MICCCSMAGTAACKNCVNNKEFDEYVYSGLEFHWEPAPVVKDLDAEYLKIISNLNKHIEDLREENKELKKKLYEKEI